MAMQRSFCANQSVLARLGCPQRIRRSVVWYGDVSSEQQIDGGRVAS